MTIGVWILGIDFGYNKPMSQSWQEQKNVPVIMVESLCHVQASPTKAGFGLVNIDIW
ncbi:MAG: hypothetical protein SAK29_26590 [Scytonema sp. PMC 1069.18]|nr:hypothetical protein [Scytonema sp. PMC 1069.18]MEC4883814.1 hypothetical protein [Scytonema sp. PMC 1070.18]